MFREWRYRQQLTRTSKWLETKKYPSTYKIEIVPQLERMVTDHTLWVHEQAYFAIGIDPRVAFGYQNLQPQASYGKARASWRALMWGSQHGHYLIRLGCFDAIGSLALHYGPMGEYRKMMDWLPKYLQDSASACPIEDVFRQWHSLVERDCVNVPSQAASLYEEVYRGDDQYACDMATIGRKDIPAFTDRKAAVRLFNENSEKAY